MFRCEVLCTFEVRNRASDFQNAVVAAGGKAEFGDRVFQDLFALGSQHAELSNVARAHLRVRVDVFVEEAAELRIARGDDAVPYSFGRLRHTGTCEVFVRNSRHVDLNIDTVHERTGDLGHVALNLWRRAEAFAPEVIREAARAGIGGRDKNERSRESECHCGASYCDSSVFGWLSVLQPDSLSVTPLTMYRST